MSAFTVTYLISLRKGESIDRKIEQICLEQSVELPTGTLQESILHNVIGTPQRKEQVSERQYQTVIEWPTDNIGSDLTSLLNLLFGNISLKPGIRIMGMDWERLPENLLPGPSFGIDKIRRMLEISDRPLSSSAIKPLGTDSHELSEKVYQMACGGIDIIKDDHGLADQSYAPFEERVSNCTDAVRQAAMDTGHRALYFPHITADFEALQERVETAHELGADGILMAPHLTGLSAMAHLADSDIRLPIIAHPAFSGTLVMHDDHGMTPGFLYGELWRALGADFAIFPNTGGRFSFSLDQCHGICESLRNSDLPFRSAFPMIGGGIDLQNLSGWIDTYGVHTTFLIGTSLYQHPDGLRSASNKFSKIVRKS